MRSGGTCMCGRLVAMRFGILMLPTDPWAESVARARHIEALGYDHLWTYDHLSWRRYRGRRWFAAIPWLTGMAVATSTIRLGPMVSTPNLRHPATFAQDVVTVDHVSNGRFILGVGAGGAGFDSTVFGAKPLGRAERVARLDEFVQLLGRLFTEEFVSYAGKYFTVNDACIRPDAVQRPRVPIAIAAGGPKALALVAKYADAWITFGDTSGRESDPRRRPKRVSGGRPNSSRMRAPRSAAILRRFNASISSATPRTGRSRARPLSTIS